MLDLYVSYEYYYFNKSQLTKNFKKVVKMKQSTRFVEEHGLSFSNKMRYMLSHYYSNGRVHSKGIIHKNDISSVTNQNLSGLSKILKEKVRKKTIFKIAMWPYPKNPQKCK